MRSVLTLSVLVSLCGFANAATVDHGHNRHKVLRPHHHMYPSVRASGLAYAPRQHYPRVDPCDKPEPYFGACQGYAPGEKERFLESVLNPY